MENSEELLTVLKAVDNSLGTYFQFEIFDLCITNKRLVVINPKLYKWRGWGDQCNDTKKKGSKKKTKTKSIKRLNNR